MRAVVRDDARNRFATTHWTMVRAASGTDADAQAALATLGRLCWCPLSAYARRDGHAPDAAEDLVQAFFVTLLQRESLRSAKAERGKFRAFLLGAFKQFITN